MFTEFNQRKAEEFKITLLGQPIHSFENRRHFNLFNEVDSFIMKNGEKLAPEQVIKSLLQAKQNSDDISDSDFVNADFESQIDYVIFKAATITLKTSEVEIGSWRLDDLDFSNKREFKSLLIFSAWLGNYDVRMDNTRLIQQDKKSKTNPGGLKMILVDVGSGLGESRPAHKLSSSEVDSMTWTVTDRYKGTQGEASMPDRVAINLFMIEPNKTFDKVDLATAQWALRQICEIKPLQIRQGLIAAGMSSAEARLTEEKLLHRRNKMILDFEMESDLKNSCFVQTNPKLDYDPNTDGALKITSDIKKTIVVAPINNMKVQNGKLISY